MAISLTSSRRAQSEAPFSIARRVVAFAAITVVAIGTLAAGVPAVAADLIITRTMPVTTGKVLSTLSWDLLYRAGESGSADGAVISEVLGGAFTNVVAATVVTAGGASSPVLTVAATANGPTISGSIDTLPSGGEVKIHVTAVLPPAAGTYQLTGSIVQTTADQLPVTNTVLTQVYARAIAIDLAVTHSDSISGGSAGQNGLSGDSVVTLDGDAAVVAPFPRTATYRMTNNGPDAAPSPSYTYEIGDIDGESIQSGDPFGAGNSAFLGAAAQFMDTVPGYLASMPDGNIVYPEFVTPLACATTGTLVCPAATVYYVSQAFTDPNGSYYSRDQDTRVVSGWLLSTPHFTTNAGGDFILVAADEAAIHTNPFPGQEVQPGDSATFTATWSDPEATLVGGILTPTETALSSTDDVTLTLPCVANDTARLINQSILYTALVNDTDMGNNTDSASAAVNRSCFQGDVRVTASSKSGGDATVTDGETITTVYTIENAGEGTASSLIGGMYVPRSNWVGNTLGTVSCVSSAPATAPCPSAAQLAAAIVPITDVTGSSAITGYSGTAPQRITGVTLTAGSKWTITITAQAGTSACTPSTAGVYSQGNERVGAYYQQVLGTHFVDISNANNFGQATLNLAPQSCPKPPTYDIAVNKAGPMDAAGTMLANVPIGGRAYYKVTVTNASTNSVLANNVYLFDSVALSTVGAGNDYVNSTAFQREPTKAAGLLLGNNNAGGSSINSGVVCSAFGGAQCPEQLWSNDYLSTDEHGYRTFAAVVPTLPPVNVDASARIELLVPYVQQGTSYNNGLITNCLSNGLTQFGRTNTASVGLISSTTTRASQLPGLPTGTPASVLTLSNGSGEVVPVTSWQETNSNNNAQSATATTVMPSCTLGQHITATQTVAAPATATSLGAGDVAAFDTVITNDGTAGMDQVRLTDQPLLYCTNGITSYSNNPCGTLGAPVVTCTVVNLTLGGQCPVGAITFTTGFSGVTWGTVGDFTTLPVGSSLRFHFEYPVANRSLYTKVVRQTVVVSGPGIARVRASSNEDAGSPAAGIGPTVVSVITLPTAPGLAIAKSVDNPLAAPGDTVTYTVTVTNGSLVAQPAGTAFADPLPAGLDSFTGVTCASGAGPAPLPANVSTCPTSIVNDSTGISAVLPEVPANTALVFTITATATDQLSSVNNSASVDTPNGAFRATTNFAVPSETGQAAIAGFKGLLNMTRPGAQDFKPGERLDYVVSYANTSIYDVPNLHIIDQLPDGVTYGGGLTVTSTGEPTVATANPAFDGVGTAGTLEAGAIIAAGGVVTVRIPVTVNATTTATTLSNQATATATGVRTAVRTDNVDDRNPTCPAVVDGVSCLPTGIPTLVGSVGQAQGADTDPNVVAVVGTPIADPTDADPVSTVVASTGMTALGATGANVAPGVALALLLLLAGSGTLLGARRRRAVAR